jgi:hypothetical protein
MKFATTVLAVALFAPSATVQAQSVATFAVSFPQVRDCSDSEKRALDNIAQLTSTRGGIMASDATNDEMWIEIESTGGERNLRTVATRNLSVEMEELEVYAANLLFSSSIECVDASPKVIIAGKPRKLEEDGENEAHMVAHQDEHHRGLQCIGNMCDSLCRTGLPAYW